VSLTSPALPITPQLHNTTLSTARYARHPDCQVTIPYKLLVTKMTKKRAILQGAPFSLSPSLTLASQTPKLHPTRP
jgi:hypothetical protein